MLSLFRTSVTPPVIPQDTTIGEKAGATLSMATGANSGSSAPSTTSTLLNATNGVAELKASEESPEQSWKSPYTSPPPVKYPYKPSEALDDLPSVSYALQTFLESHMLEAEEYCHKCDEKKERLYFATGFGLIQCLKGLMSFEDVDLLAGIAHTKQGNHIASLHRKQQAFLGSRVAGYFVSAIHPNSIAFIKSMNAVERHAELVYAESLFEKALLGIVYSGDWLAFIKEALNMRTTISIYRQLGEFIDHADAEAKERGEGPTGKSIDEHFRTGVYIGVGLSNIILSMMPGKLMTLVELFGYHGDRKLGLETLLKAGGWRHDSDEPDIPAANEGIRRSIADMALLIFHLVLSSFTFEGVDVSMARKILDWNLKRFPNGVFFLFGAGRLALCRSQPERAIHYYTKAMESQSQYRNLHHISFWEIAIANLSLWDVPASQKCWKELEAESTWSKAIYSYGLAVCLLQTAETEEQRKEAGKIMAKVPELRQKIAGKSIPLEKFVARKARKFGSQHGRLALAPLELGYLFQGIQHAPRKVIIEKMLPEIDKVLGKVEQYKGNEEEYEGGHGGYWDDFCLARFLQGVCLRYVAYPDPDADLDDTEVLAIPKVEAQRKAEDAFSDVFEHGPKIELDHHLVYYAHYELGRLLGCEGKDADARQQFELVLSGKHLEVGASGRKGKYSLESALLIRTHAANDALHQRRL